MAVQEHYHDPTLRIVSERHAVLVAWRNAPTAEQMRALIRVARSISKLHPNKMMFWNAVLGGTPNFSEDVRKEVAYLTSERSLQGTATAHLILIDGFAGAATRAFFGAVMLATRTPVPTKVFGDVKTAAAWMAQRGAGIEGSPDAAAWERLHGELLGG
jgi:hypothetical protein